MQILKKGEVQVNEKEREHDLTALRKEIATHVAEKCVDPVTQRPYPVGIIEKAMAEAGFSVKQNKNAKSQVPYFSSLASPVPLILRAGVGVYPAVTDRLKATDPTGADARADNNANRGWEAIEGKGC